MIVGRLAILKVPTFVPNGAVVAANHLLCAIHGQRLPRSALGALWGGSSAAPPVRFLVTNASKSLVLGDYGTVWDKRGHF